MQLKIFTVMIDAGITDEQLSQSVFKFDLRPRSPHPPVENVMVTVSNAQLLNSMPVPVLEAELKIAKLLSRTILIRLTYDGPANLNDVELFFNEAYAFDHSESTQMLRKYEPLHNYYDGSGDLGNDINYTSPFTTTALNIGIKSKIDIKLQFSYDQSVNIIFSDDANPIRLVNSRWILSEDGTEAALADRTQTKDTNTYSDFNFHRTELIPVYNGIPKLTFNGVFNGGALPGGGYHYYFRYVTADGAETDICEESRLVEVHKGDKPTVSMGALSSEPTMQYTSFTLSNLDDSFHGIRVYYSIAQGEVAAVSNVYKIPSPFAIERGICNIIHTGVEPVEAISGDQLLIRYSDIANAKTIDAANNRLLVGNTDAGFIYSDKQRRLASSCIIEEDRFSIVYTKDLKGDVNENYSNATFTYSKLGYWRGESYELGVVFLKDGNQSVVYPIHGIDNIDGTATYNLDLIGNTSPGFYINGENSLGVYRTAESLDELWVSEAGNINFRGTHLKVKIDHLIPSVPDDLLFDEYDGFYFVRRKRKKDRLMQGLLSPVVSIPTLSSVEPDAVAVMAGNWLGIGVNSSEYSDNVTFIPAPNCLMPFGAESFYWNIYDNDVDGVNKKNYTDFILKAPILDFGGSDDPDNKRLNAFAFYSPDIDCNTAGSAALYDGSRKWVNILPQAIPTEYEIEFNKNDENLSNYLPLYLKLSTTFSDTVPFTWRFATEANYIESNSFSPARRTFSGNMDRHLYIWQQNSVAYANDYTYFIDCGSNPEDSDGRSIVNPFGDGSNDGLGFYPAGTGVNGDAEGNVDGAPKLDSYMREGLTPGSSVHYGRYVGLNIPSYQTGLDGLNMTTKYDGSAGNSEFVYTNTNYQSSKGTELTNDDTYSYGYIADIYEGNAGKPLTRDIWETRYLHDESSAYFSISRRYDIHEFELGAVDQWLDLYGGDCYLGMQWKQVWGPKGVPEAPGVSDLDPYRIDRTALGMLNYGFAIPIPVQSNYNFHMRTKERFDDREYRAFGKDRSFLPVKKDIRGDRQPETGYFNFGYDINGPIDHKLYRLNSDTPFVRITYPNRVYASNPGVENEFWSGFTIFQGLNFKDYNSELGYLTKIITSNNITFLIFHHGITSVGVNERSIISTDTGGIFTDSYDVLAPKTTVLTNHYGSQHLLSVTNSINYVYGVDALNKKIWAVNHKGLNIISDFRIQTLLTGIIDDMEDLAKTDPLAFFNIHTAYDLLKHDVSFTFSVTQEDTTLAARTLIYNENLQIWVCETNDTRKFMFKSNEDRYSFNKFDEDGVFYRYYRPEINDKKSYYNKFYGTVYDARLRFNIIDNPGEAKIFENIYVMGNNSMPTKANYTMEGIVAIKEQPLIPMTNVTYIIPDIVVNGTQDEFLLRMLPATNIIKPNGEPLGTGDFISLVDDAGGTQYLVVINYENGVIEIDKALPNAVTGKMLIYGYRNPIRRINAAFENEYTKLQINTGLSSKIYIPRGKWMQTELQFEGMAPMFLSGIFTSYTLSYS